VTSISTEHRREGWQDRAERPRPLLLAHRGARRSAPENSFKAFNIALRHGCDGFEFDVQRTADGVPLICHEPKYLGLVIHKTKFADFAGVFTLPEVIKRYASKAFLDIELKVAGLEEVTLQAIAAAPPKHGYLVSSFLPEVLHRMYELDPHSRLALICQNRRQLGKWRRVPCNAVIARVNLVNEKLRAATKEAGKQLMVWTVNDADEMLRFAELGVDAIISDDTRLLTDVLRPKRPSGQTARKK
jgi:glycerophosphoryl diester phosphodiesterase